MTEEEYPLIDPNKPIENLHLSNEEIIKNLIEAKAVITEGCECGATLEKVDDLIFDTIINNEHIVIPHLTGIKCSKCGFKAIDQKSMHIIEKYTKKSKKITIGFKETIRKIGKNQALYIPKDIIQDLHLHSGISATFYPHTKHSVVVVFKVDDN